MQQTLLIQEKRFAINDEWVNRLSACFFRYFQRHFYGQVVLLLRDGRLEIPVQLQEGFLAPIMDWLRNQQEVEGSNDDIVNPMYHIPDTLQMNKIE